MLFHLDGRLGLLMGVVMFSAAMAAPSLAPLYKQVVTVSRVLLGSAPVGRTFGAAR